MPLINDLNVDQLRVPLGFVKIPQLLFAIIAFTARSGWEFSASFTCKGAKTPTTFTITDFVFGKASYTDFKTCDGRQLPLVDFDFGTSARLFGFISLVSIVFVLVMLFIYLFRWGFYAGDERLPKVDAIATFVIAVVWFFAVWGWWSARSSLVQETSHDHLLEKFKDGGFCDDKDSKTFCDFRSYASTAPLTVSVLAGFGSLLLFSINVWFAYKETAWFHARKSTSQPSNDIA